MGKGDAACPTPKTTPHATGARNEAGRGSNGRDHGDSAVALWRNSESPDVSVTTVSNNAAPPLRYFGRRTYHDNEVMTIDELWRGSRLVAAVESRPRADLHRPTTRPAAVGVGADDRHPRAQRPAHRQPARRRRLPHPPPTRPPRRPKQLHREPRHAPAPTAPWRLHRR